MSKWFKIVQMTIQNLQMIYQISKWPFQISKWHNSKCPNDISKCPNDLKGKREYQKQTYIIYEYIHTKQL